MCVVIIVIWQNNEMFYNNRFGEHLKFHVTFFFPVSLTNYSLLSSNKWWRDIRQYLNNQLNILEAKKIGSSEWYKG